MPLKCKIFKYFNYKSISIYNRLTESANWPLKLKVYVFFDFNFRMTVIHNRKILYDNY